MLDLPVVLIFFASALAALALLATRRWHEGWTGDPHTGGIQKHHVGAPPRVGLLPIGLALVLGCAWLASGGGTAVQRDAAILLGTLLLCAVPAAGLGLLEDLTKRVSPRTRMAGAALSAGLAIALLGAQVSRFDIPGVDTLLALAPVSILVTVLMVSGFTNAMNIIDGLNGLAGGLALVMLAATGLIAHQMGDAAIATTCLLVGAAVLGFLVFNFPRGAIFLGDGGAYLLGFLIVELWILLTVRNPEVTVWVAPVIGFLPTFETIFSIIRRKFIHRRKAAAMAPDRLHLHSLLYRRRMLYAFSGVLPQRRWAPNAAASLVLVTLAGLPGLAAVAQPHSPAMNAFVFAAAAVAYLWLFMRLTQSRLVMNRPDVSDPQREPVRAVGS